MLLNHDCSWSHHFYGQVFQPLMQKVAVLNNEFTSYKQKKRKTYFEFTPFDSKFHFHGKYGINL